MESTLAQVFDSTEAMLIEVIMSPDQKYEPRLNTQKLPDGTLSSLPLDDLQPLIPLDLLEDLLANKAHRNSYLSRGLAYD